MAKEIKSITVAPSEEEAAINLWQSFGWELKSTQTIKTQDVQVFTGQDSDGTEHYRTTKGEHHVKLTFEREKSNPNYAELCDLEQKYYDYANQNLEKPVEPNKPSGPCKDKPGCWTWGCSILAIWAGVCVFLMTDLGEDVRPMGIVVIIVGIAIFIIRMRMCRSYNSEEYAKYSKKLEEYPQKHALWVNEFNNWEKKCNEITKARSEIIERATSLLQ